MKKILYLTFYFEPDLCAGSFRNTPLLKELARQVEGKADIDVITTLPNRYSSFNVDAKEYEEHENYRISRIKIPKHQSGMMDQVNSFKAFYMEARKIVKKREYDLVVASSSRLFTAYLGYKIAKDKKAPLYLDIRDIFTDTMTDVLKSPVLRTTTLPVLHIIERKVFNYAQHINLISGGFKSYFEKFRKPEYSEYPNGVDEEFLNIPPSIPSTKSYKTIVYAGNIGEGQGLHIIVPQAAKKLGNSYRFIIIGDGGAKQKLETELEKHQVTNVELRNPVKREELLTIYNEADFLFIHLNDYDAFKKVLPSKVFELAAYDKPIIAGVAGFAHEFIKTHVSNRILFLPGDVEEFTKQLTLYKYENVFRKRFIDEFKRSSINYKMAESIRQYL